MIFQILGRFSGLRIHDVSRGDVQKQLEREYGLSLDHINFDDRT